MLEKPFLLSETDKKQLFDLTIVVPAYNETSRLPTMMKDTLPVNLIRNKYSLIVFGEESKRRQTF